MDIVEVDPYDDAAVAAWHATYATSDRFGREETATIWQLGEVLADWQADLAHRWVGGWSGLVDGEVVTTGYLRLSLMDNLNRASLEVQTHPEHRRRGYGSAMLAHLEDVARERGRSVVGADVAFPYDAPEDGAGHPNADFATRHGFTYALGDIQRRLDLPVDDGLLDRLADEAASRASAYSLRSFVGRAPDDVVEAYAAMTASLTTEAPTGELELEPETSDVGAFRDYEELMARQGRTRHTTLAFAPDGTLAGYTELVSTIHEPGRIYQWGTLVPGAHRGHRLGLALKVANLRFLQELQPDAHSVTTWNAEVNSHMIGVNELLGFRPVERMAEFQKKLG
jgi:GNAT superfamily N-acetyltransferase/RimJ/RimL family protein N-acetyltransferase